MRYILSILLALSAFNLNVYAKGKNDDALSRMTFGLEWGYVASVHSGYHYSFFAPEGYRVSEKGESFEYSGNADMYFHFGYNLTPQWNLSMYIGYEGIADYHKAIPVSLRMTRYFNPDSTQDRWFSFVDIGSGICLKNPVQEIMTGKLGAGYRLALSRKSALDFHVAARVTHTHPQLFYDKTPIPFEKTNKNFAFISAISLGMALTF